MPSQGEGEQSTKSGGPCPYDAHPELCWRFENEFAVLVTGELATAICSGCCLDAPVESETNTAKLKFPVVLGVPAMAPLVSSSSTPVGSAPEASEKM